MGGLFYPFYVFFKKGAFLRFNKQLTYFQLMVPPHSLISLPRPQSCERVQLKLRTAGEQIPREWRYLQLPKMPSQPC